MRECVAAFVIRENKILFGRRSAERTFYPNIWDVFGGHLENGESIEDVLRRELGEELGIEPTEFVFLTTVNEPHPAENGAGIYHFYLVTDFDGEPQNLQPHEHAFVRWFSFKESLKLEFAHPLYLELIRQISNERRSE